MFLTNTHPQTLICTQLFEGKLANENWEYYEVNINIEYCENNILNLIKSRNWQIINIGSSYKVNDAT